MTQLPPRPSTRHSKESDKSKSSTDSGIDTDYRPIKVRVFRNNDRFDIGTDITITRKAFKHWLHLLDVITTKTKSTHPVQHLYDLDGDEVTEFQELEDNGRYVATGHENFKNLQYGTARARAWQPTSRPRYVEPSGVDSHESIEIYLRKMGFESQTGKRYPFDNPEKDPATKAAIHEQTLEKVMRRQQLKGERAATRMSQYRSDDSLPRISRNQRVVAASTSETSADGNSVSKGYPDGGLRNDNEEDAAEQNVDYRRRKSDGERRRNDHYHEGDDQETERRWRRRDVADDDRQHRGGVGAGGGGGGTRPRTGRYDMYDDEYVPRRRRRSYDYEDDGYVSERHRSVTPPPATPPQTSRGRWYRRDVRQELDAPRTRAKSTFDRNINRRL